MGNRAWFTSWVLIGGDGLGSFRIDDSSIWCESRSVIDSEDSCTGNILADTTSPCRNTEKVHIYVLSRCIYLCFRWTSLDLILDSIEEQFLS